MNAGYPTVLEQYRERVDAALETCLDGIGGPDRLREAMGYSLLAGGKRIRPVLVLAARDLFPTSGVSDPMPLACAFELIHTYSLIHDDLPAMDNDDYRRGRPSSHRQFGEAIAILAGDALLTEAFRLVAAACTNGAGPICARLLNEISAAAGAAGMVGGQVLDTIETGRVLDRQGLEEVHRLKTGALIAAAAKCGAIAGEARDREVEILAAYGDCVGLAFQVADDVLDATGDRACLGKSVGKDEACGKNTYVRLMGLEGSRRYARDLVSRATNLVAPFGERAAALTAMAAFVVERVN